MSLTRKPEGPGWTPERRELHALIANHSDLLGEYCASAIYFLHSPTTAPARLSHFGHAVRELCNHLPDALNITKFDRSDADGKVRAFAAAWEKAELPSEPDVFTQADAAGNAEAMTYPVPRPVAAAAAEVVMSNRVRGTYRRRAALMIVDPDAPVGRSRAEDDPTVDRWVGIYDKLMPWVHRFDLTSTSISEADLSDDFSFLEDVIRGVLAPLDAFAELDDLLAATRPRPTGDLDCVWPEPTIEQLQQLQRWTATAHRAAYFFDRLDNPRWLRPLADNGWFALERLPEPVRENDETVRIDAWAPLSYLVRTARAEPEMALEITRTARGSTNPLIQREFVKVLQVLPPNDVAAFTEDVQRWMQGPYPAYLNENDLTSLAAKLLEAHETSAGAGLALTLLTLIHEEYVLREIVTALIEPLATAGRSGVDVVTEALDRRADRERGLEGINYHRVSIAPHEQDPQFDPIDSLIDGVRDVGLAYLRGTADLRLLDDLMARPHTLYQRIACHLAAALLVEDTADDIEDETLAAAPLYSWARNRVLDREALMNPRLRLEYGNLVHAMLPYLGATDIATLTSWISEGPQLSVTARERITEGLGSDAEKEQALENLADRWRAERLALLGPNLPPPLQAIADELTAKGVPAPRHPGLSHVITPWVSPPAPLSTSEIAAMPVARLLEWLAGYTPSGYPLIDSPEFALSRRITEDVIARPAEYSAEAATFASLDPVYVSGLLSGLRQALSHSNRSDLSEPHQPRLDITWDAVLELARSLTDITDDGSAKRQQPEGSIRWLHRELANVINLGLVSTHGGLTLECASKVLAVIARLLDSPDPTPADERVEEATDDPQTGRSIQYEVWRYTP